MSTPRKWTRPKNFVLSSPSSISPHTASPPIWEDAVKILGLEIVTNLEEEDKVTGYHFSIRYCGLDLKAWQPQISAWIAQMCNDAPTDARIVADDVGFGKTFAAYVFLCEMAEEIERQLQACLDEPQLPAPRQIPRAIRGGDKGPNERRRLRCSEQSSQRDVPVDTYHHRSQTDWCVLLSPIKTELKASRALAILFVQYK